MTALHRRGSKLRCVGLPPRGMVRSTCLTYNTEYPRTPTGPDGHSPFDHLEFAAQSSQRSGSASCSEASSRTPSSPSCFDQSRWNQYAPSCEGLRARRGTLRSVHLWRSRGILRDPARRRFGAHFPRWNHPQHDGKYSCSGQHCRRAPPCRCG